MPVHPTTILLVDDHPLVMRGLRLLIEQRTAMKVLGEVATGQAALDFAQHTPPDIAIIDIHLPDINGIELAGRFREKHPLVRVAMLSSDSSPTLIEQALAVGVSGYLLKECAPTELEQALHTIAAGDMYICPRANTIAWKSALGKPATPPPEDQSPLLSRRETEVLRGIASGSGTKEVASDLGLSVKTVETYRRRLMKKLRLRSVADITRYAVRHGIVEA